MATAGERFEMPDGSVYIVRRPAAETDGEWVEMEFVPPSGCVPPPTHTCRTLQAAGIRRKRDPRDPRDPRAPL